MNIQTLTKTVGFQADPFCPFGQRQRRSVISNQPIVSPIAVLFFWRSPSAVSRLVVAVVIRKSINRFSLGRLAHVLYEISKILYPRLAYSNISSTIERILSIPWIIATGFHAGPCMIGARLRQSVTESLLRPLTAAALSFAASQRAATYRFSCSTLAAASPAIMVFRSAIKGNYGPGTENSPREVYLFHRP